MTKPTLEFKFSPAKHGIALKDEGAALNALAQYSADAAAYAVTGRVPYAPAIEATITRRGKEHRTVLYPHALAFVSPDISRSEFGVFLIEYTDRGRRNAYHPVGEVIVRATRPSVPEGPYDHEE